MNRREAQSEARRILRKFREDAATHVGRRTYKNWTADYSDPQLWALILRAKSTVPDVVAVELLCLILNDEPIPSADYLDDTQSA